LVALEAWDFVVGGFETQQNVIFGIDVDMSRNTFLDLGPFGYSNPMDDSRWRAIDSGLAQSSK